MEKDIYEEIIAIFNNHIRLCPELYDNISISQISFDENLGFNSDLHIYVKTNYRLNSSNNSLYNYSRDSLFIHYTSLKSLLSIISERTLRLYSLDNVNDPNELRYASEMLKFNELDFNIMKKNVFAFSMCEFNNDEKLDIWRLYGTDGTGVGIILSIDRSNIDSWNDFSLSRILYGEDNRKHFNKLNLIIENFKGELSRIYKGKIEISILLDRLFALHKKHYFEFEKEVRICYSTIFFGDNHTPENRLKHGKIVFPKFIPDINRFNKKVNYLELPILGNKDYKGLLNYLPIIKIEGVKLGYRYNEMDVAEIKNVINELSLESLGYRIDNVELSVLKDQIR